MTRSTWLRTALALAVLWPIVALLLAYFEPRIARWLDRVR